MLSWYKWYFSWPWYKWYPQAVSSIIEAQLSFILDDVKVAPLLFSFEINVQLPEDMQGHARIPMSTNFGECDRP